MPWSQLRTKNRWLAVLILWLTVSAGFCISTNAFLVITNLAQLHQSVSGNMGKISTFRLEGTVLDSDARLGIICLQDGTGSQLLEVELSGAYPEPGERIRLEGTNYLTLTEAGISLGSRPLIDNNGRHGEVKRCTSIELKAGRYPIQVLWFNGFANGSVKVSYSGPGFGSRSIPDALLRREEDGGLTNGLNYRCYLGDWLRVPAFNSLTPVKTGNCPNFSVNPRVRPEMVGLAFDGYIEIDKDGLYTFYISSDDGSQLFLNKTTTKKTVLGMGTLPLPKPITIRQPLIGEQGGVWCEAEGVISFVGRGKNQVELELTSEGTHMRVLALGDHQPAPRYLMGSRVRVRGLCIETSKVLDQRLADLMVIPGLRAIQVIELGPEIWPAAKRLSVSACMAFDESSVSNIVCLRGVLSPVRGNKPLFRDDSGSVSVELLNGSLPQIDDEIECVGRWTRSGTNGLLCEAVWRKLPGRSEGKHDELPLLTTAAQVQQLKREQARLGYNAKIRGVVTWVAENKDCVVLQDSTRGVFVGLDPGWIWETPRVGEILEVQGKCAAAEFTPIVVVSKGERLGWGRLPSPMYPTRDQLISGSTDSQYVELRGFVTSAYDNHLVLLMSGGKIDVEFTPIPAELSSYVNCVVRIRGCIFAKWDYSTLLITPDHPLWFGSATISVDIPAPLDAFSADLFRTRELMQYDAEANLFRRVKVQGQVLCRNRGTYYMTDGGIGLRFEPTQPVLLNPGDEVEVVGLVELGGPSPVLREAIARRIGHSDLRAPEALNLARTNRNHDATRVWVEGLLLDSKDSGGERQLEMQIGLKQFSARVKLPPNPADQWPVGSRLRLTGIYSDLGTSFQQSRGLNSFELLVDSPSDVLIIARAPWWTLNRLLGAIALLVAVLALAFIWIRLLQGQVERRTVQLKREIGERERAEQGRAIEQERARIARDLHDDLGSSLTAINMLAMPPRNADSNASGERLTLIADKTRLMVTTLDELVWAVNPKNDTLSGLVEYIASFAEELLARTDVVCRLEVPLDFPARTVAAEARHNVLLSAREALNNAVRHGQPSEILLQVAVTEEKLGIVIRDNGKGFDLASRTTGNGLCNLKDRMAKVNGTFEIQSSPGSGTIVSLTLPI